MNLKELAKHTTAIKPNHSILIYGPPKSGKTKLVGTAAEIAEIQRIFWFDLENGAETLIHMGLSDEQMEKIILIRIPDTRESPVGIETMLRAFSAKTAIDICDEHGKVSCVLCKGKANIKFALSDLGHHDLVVIDSGSQLGDSAISATCKGKDVMFKPGWDEYALVGKWLGDILSVIQQAHHTNFVVITHEIALEGDDKRDRMYPLMGSKAFSMKVAKYFGTVAYVHMKLGKHAAGSKSTYRADTLTGSRVNAALEDSKTPDMRSILIEGGIIKPTSTQ